MCHVCYCNSLIWLLSWLSGQSKASTINGLHNLPFILIHTFQSTSPEYSVPKQLCCTSSSLSLPNSSKLLCFFLFFGFFPKEWTSQSPQLLFSSGLAGQWKAMGVATAIFICYCLQLFQYIKGAKITLSFEINQLAHLQLSVSKKTLNMQYKNYFFMPIFYKRPLKGLEMCLSLLHFQENGGFFK